MLNNQDVAYWCVVKDRQLYLENQTLPLSTPEQLGFSCDQAHLIGHFHDKPVYWLEVTESDGEAHFYSQRELLHLDGELFNLAGKATQLSHMLSSQAFCAACGERCHLAVHELAMACPACQIHHYPRLSPCVIVAVRKDDQVLLAQHPRHKTGMYTVIAGFVEAGETLEQCVAREVKEETGIDVTNIRYVASQPWAFPSNLMMGFLADYAGGELKPDYTELSDAIWARADNLPPVAPPGTIARTLIEATLELM
ncbi:NAD(+) diphosphatase [Photobacterium sp. TY1-4]|uniref:NAD(+) diphosphatase n=1 Tax=Photobacterium sp. TY1-4 TaxID=2899122 RepID=UPI0021BE97D4|nr:NAD(+) diphosphatase [Photobacterium sp. TY1-4]UXI01148.1 NAD(+) diphosphatase [Photobacterium sp. TY1-4]